METGVVKWFDPERGFGFVLNEDGMDVFVHYTNIDKDGFRCLRTGQEVQFEQFESDKGLQGKEVKVISCETQPRPQIGNRVGS